MSILIRYVLQILTQCNKDYEGNDENNRRFARHHVGPLAECFLEAALHSLLAVRL